MPICRGKDDQGDYITWSHKTGKKYRPDEEGGEAQALAKARKQAAAAHAAGYQSDRDRCMRKGEKQVKAEVYGEPRRGGAYLREDSHLQASAAGTVPAAAQGRYTRQIGGSYYGSTGVVGVDTFYAHGRALAAPTFDSEAELIDAFLRR